MQITIRIESLAKLWKMTINEAEQLLINKKLRVETITYYNILNIALKSETIRYKKSEVKYGARTPYTARRSRPYLRKLVDELYAELYDYVRTRDGNRCVICGRGSRNKLNVHHKDHVHGNMTADNMESLCWTCHKTKHFGTYEEVCALYGDGNEEGIVCQSK